MNKKLFLTVITLISISSCGGNKLPPEMRDFLDNIDYTNTFNLILSGETKVTYNEKQDSAALGNKSEILKFSKDVENKKLYYSYEANFSGNQIKDNVLKKYTLMTYDEIKDEYVLESAINDEIEKKVISYEDAFKKIVNVFFTKQHTIREGGLYYGEYFTANIHTLLPFYKIEEDAMVFQTSDENYYEGALLEQYLKIDKYGMLIECNEKITIKSNGQSGEYTIKSDFSYLDV